MIASRYKFWMKRNENYYVAIEFEYIYFLFYLLDCELIVDAFLSGLFP